ncbi:tetratricopeptide repeat protein [Leptospira sp. 'Mane']|uniref:tetratricopeptide repeat protein n=1 Tax=Leptospira sp. 'Mane' TaxID=3387407 RepID=UPI00398B6FDE
MFRYLFLFALLFFGSLPVLAQKQIGDKEYPEILWGKDQEFDTSDFPGGSFIYHKEDFILATGKLFQGPPPPSVGSFTYGDRKITNSGEWNNEAVKLIISGKEKEKAEAKKMLEAGVRFDPQFFPFRYNLGRLYSLDFNYEGSLVQFEYAKAEVPEYFKTYLHIAILSELTRQIYYAIMNYKLAADKNPYDTEALIRMSDHYLATGLKNRALIYLNKALTIDEESPNVRLGFGRLEMEKGNYHIAYKIFNRTSLTTGEGKQKPYDKKFHYYFAETASKITDYETAEQEYTKMLQFKNDPFFASVSTKVIMRRRDIARKFAEAKRTQLDDSEEEVTPEN